MPLINTTLDTAVTEIYSSIGDTGVSVVYFCNTGGTTTFNLYLVPSGGSASPTNIVYNNVQVASNDTYVMDTEKLILGNGDKIVAQAGTPFVLGVSGIVATVCWIGA
jgi:hypothetical protein